jgi:hypothetical protein
VDVHLAISSLDPGYKLVEAFLSVHVEDLLECGTGTIESFARLKTLANTFMCGPMRYLALAVAVIHLSYRDIVANVRGIFGSKTNLGRWLAALSASGCDCVLGRHCLFC